MANISRRSLLVGLSCITVGTAASDHTPAYSAEAASDGDADALRSGVNAMHSDTFVEAISVNAHLNWRNTIWDNPAWRQALVDLGVRHIRTMMGSSKPARDDLKWLYDAAGIRACVLVSPYTKGSVSPVYDRTKTQRFLDFVRHQIGTEKVTALEGPNEPNNDKTDGWQLRTRDHQAWTYSRVKDDRALAHLPVLTPSIYRRITADYADLGDLTGMADAANLHYYTNGSKPITGMKGRTEASMDDVIRDAQAMLPDSPLWVTEYGHQVRDDPRKRSAHFVSPLVSAKYGLRGMGEFFRRGIRHICWYSLIDDYPQNEDQFGLLAYSETASLQPRPSYFALKRLIDLLADPGPAFAPTGLAYRIFGDLTDVRHILFQKRDGRYLLMIWQDATSWNRRTATEIAVPPRSVTLELGRTVESVTVYEPTMSDTPTTLSMSSATASMRVSDHVLIVEIAP